jgi:hypothetical protein
MTRDDVLFGYRLQLFDLAGRVGVSDGGEPLSARRSPRRGRVEDIFNRLVSIPSLLCPLRTRAAAHPPRRAPRLSTRERVPATRLGRGRPPAGLGRAAPPHHQPRRCRPAAPAQPARALRHRPARRGSRDRAPARPTDDLLPESTGGPPPRDRQTRQRHRPPPRRRKLTCGRPRGSSANRRSPLPTRPRRFSGTTRSTMAGVTSGRAPFETSVALIKSPHLQRDRVDAP